MLYILSNKLSSFPCKYKCTANSFHFFEGLFDFPSEKLNWAVKIFERKKKELRVLTTHLVFPLNDYKTLNEHTTTPFSLFQLLAIKPKTFIIYSLQVVIFDLSSIILHSVWAHRGATKTHIKQSINQVYTYIYVLWCIHTQMLCYT